MSDNPLRLLLLGITGDLSKGKILPALYHLERTGRLPATSQIIGTSRKDVTGDAIIESVRQTLADEPIPLDESALQALQDKLTIRKLDPVSPDGYPGLVEELSDRGSVAGWLVYLSLPPTVYGKVIGQLGKHGFSDARLLIEKPFGYDTASAEQLSTETREHFDEANIYRVDHYLEKPALADLLSELTRSPLADQWNGQSVSSLTITAAESIGIAGRVGFYDQIGAMRDLVQSHLLQLLASLIAGSSDSGDRDGALRQLLPADPAQATRGQYIGYTDEIGTADSTVETYADISIRSQDPVWQDTSFRLITGKALARKCTTVDVRFDDGSSYQYDLQASHERDTSYERVLLDATAGVGNRFVSQEQVMRAWNVVQPLLDAWQGNDEGLRSYDKGSDWPL